MKRGVAINLNLGLTLAALLTLSLAAACAAPASPPTPTSPPKAASEKPNPAAAAKPTSAPAASGPAAKVRVGVLTGGQAFPIQVMQNVGIDKKYNLDIDRKDTVDTDAAYTMLRTRDVDIAFGGWMTIAKLWTQGEHLLNVYSDMAVLDDVLVKQDSPLKSYADLKGKKVGIFGGPAGTTTLILRMETQKFFGFDLIKESQVQYGAPPMLAGFMEKGDIDAALMMDPYVSKMTSSGKYRSIGEMGTIWQEKVGWPLLLVTVNTQEDWAAKNPQVIKNFNAAFKESVDYLKAHSEVWPELAKSYGLETRQEADTLRSRLEKQVMARWDDELINQQLQFATEAMQFGGPDVLPYIPKESFTTKYVP